MRVCVQQKSVKRVFEREKFDEIYIRLNSLNDADTCMIWF